MNFKEKKDRAHQKATEECWNNKYIGKLKKLCLPFLDNFHQDEDRFQQYFARIDELQKQGKWRQEPIADDDDLAAMISSSASEMGWRRCKKRSLGNFYLPIDSISAALGRYNPIASRLYLLWLNLLLIPTRIRYMHKRNFRGPYGQSNIINRSTGQ
jgi:hypothetical protein